MNINWKVWKSDWRAESAILLSFLLNNYMISRASVVIILHGFHNLFLKFIFALFIIWQKSTLIIIYLIAQECLHVFRKGELRGSVSYLFSIYSLVKVHFNFNRY